MNIAFCHPSVVPARGGCETYIGDLARRLVADGHELHIYASHWDPGALPAAVHFHELPRPRGPRSLRPWRFGASCERALRHADHDVSLGFDKTWGQDVLYPQGGLHAACTVANSLKHRHPLWRPVYRWIKCVDLAHWSFSMLEKRQYQGRGRPLVVVNSELVRGHFRRYFPTREVRVVHSAIDPSRFGEHDRPRRRLEWRQHWGIVPDETVWIENPAAVVDKYADRHKTRDLAEAFVEFLHGPEAQAAFVELGFRPLDRGDSKGSAAAFPQPARLFTVDDLGGWNQVSGKLFGPQGLWTKVVESLARGK